jgi:hypothetical protein
MCLYHGQFFVNPIGLVDPQWGHLTDSACRVYLQPPWNNESNFAATREFLHSLEGFAATGKPESRSRKRLEAWQAKRFAVAKHVDRNHLLYSLKSIQARCSADSPLTSVSTNALASNCGEMPNRTKDRELTKSYPHEGASRMTCAHCQGKVP